MLQVNQISVDLGNKQIIDNLTFSINKGILVILGLNGSGKTTLLRTIAGVLKIKKGTIQIDNVNISKLTKKEIAKLISFVPQEYSSIFDYSVEEMILFGRTPHIKTFNLPSTNDYKIVSTILQEMNIEHLKYRQFNQLSGGEKRLVLISMSLAQNTEIVLLDEPTTFLDIKNSMLIINKIKKLANDFNKTLIISMHDINDAIYVADKILMLYDKNCYLFNDTNKIITEENLYKLYQVKFEIDRTKDKFVVVNRF